MTSILDGAREFVTPSLLSNVSSQTGESESAVSKGFAAVIPTLLASIANRSSDSGFMRQLASLATSAPSDPDAVTRSPQPVVAADGTLDTSTPTGGWLSSLTGGSLSGMTSAVARYAGLRASSASSLLSVGAPLVLGYIGRLMRSDNLDATRLAQRFQAERGLIAAAVPSGLGSYLPGMKVPTERVRAVAAESVPRETSSGRWILPLVLAALVVGGLFWWLSRDCTVPDVGGVSQTVGDATRAAGGAIGSAAATLRRSLPGGVEVAVPAGSMEDRLIAYLASPTGTGQTFDLDRIEFQGGSTALSPQSREQIENVANILKAYPAARVSIAGYTDDTGDEAANVTLSRGRAEAVMAALQEAGVPAANMRAEGFGSRNPIADNSSEAGRARNRRVTLTVSG